ALDHRLSLRFDGDPLDRRLAGDDPVDAIAVHGARGDAVDANAVGRQLEGHAVRHAHLPRLGRAVADPIGQPATARPRGDIDDGAAARLDHLRDHETGAEVGAGETGIDGVPPVLHRLVVDGLGDSAVARIVHEDVDLPDGLEALGDAAAQGLVDG